MEDITLQPVKFIEFKEQMFKGFPDSIVIFDFWNNDCVSCEDQHIELKKLEEEHKDIIVYKVNIDIPENREFAKIIKLKNLPTLLFLKKRKLFRFNGFTNYEELDFLMQTDKTLCINCKNYKTSKSNTPEHYYCKKYKIYTYLKDSC